MSVHQDTGMVGSTDTAMVVVTVVATVVVTDMAGRAANYADIPVEEVTVVYSKRPLVWIEKALRARP